MPRKDATHRGLVCMALVCPQSTVRTDNDSLLWLSRRLRGASLGYVVLRSPGHGTDSRPTPQKERGGGGVPVLCAWFLRPHGEEPWASEEVTVGRAVAEPWKTENFSAACSCPQLPS